MRWGRNNLKNELIIFFAILNGNVISAMLNTSSNRDEVFRVLVTSLNNFMAKIILKKLTPKKLQKIMEKDSDLKIMWNDYILSNQKIEPEVSQNNTTNYFS